MILIGMCYAEIELGAKCVVDMDGNQTALYNPVHGIKDGYVMLFISR